MLDLHSDDATCPASTLNGLPTSLTSLRLAFAAASTLPGPEDKQVCDLGWGTISGGAQGEGGRVLWMVLGVLEPPHMRSIAAAVPLAVSSSYAVVVHLRVVELPVNVG